MKTQYMKKRFWLFYYAGMLVFSVIAAMLMKYNQHGNALDPTVVVAFFTIFLVSASIGHLTIYMVKKFEKYDHSQLVRKILPALLIFYVIAFLIANVAVSLGVLGWYLYMGEDLSGFFPHLFKYELSFANARFFMWLMFFTIAFFYILWQKSAKREQLLIEENLKYRYNTLKSQVNPHFLFNSLNTLSEMVYTDVKKADSYMQKLSGIYRYILENEETDLISLREELEFVKQYFSLQKERANGKISLKIDCPHCEKYKIIPVSIQLLIENALKHNAMSEKSPLDILVYSDDEYVVVSNALQRKNVIESSAQTGLSNLRERVKLIMGKEIIISEDAKQFIVKLPIIRK